MAEGLYAPEVGAEKLGLTPEMFREQMKRFGFLQEEEAAEPEPAAEPEQAEPGEAESETAGSEPPVEPEPAAEPETAEPGQPGPGSGEEPSAGGGEGTTDSEQAAEA